MNVPVLRFPEFEGAWEEKRLGDNLELFRKRVGANTDTPIYSSSRNGLKPQKDYFAGSELTNEGEYGVVPRGYFTYRHMSDDLTFKFNINDVHDEIAVSKEYPVFTTTKLCSDFLLWKLNHGVSFRRFAAMQKLGGTRTRLYFKTLETWKTQFPSLPEQKKIAAFLGVVDQKLVALAQVRAGLQTYKRGLMQKLFAQDLRFTKPDGSAFPDWEEKRADKLFASVSNKKHIGDLPLLAITQERGAVLRDDIDIDIKATATSVLSYKIVEPRDFIISLRSFQGGIEYSKVLGICSPAYTILKPLHPISDGFFQSFFKDADFISRLSATVVGIREGKQISYSAFSTLILPYPHPDEQRLIADALQAMDAKIAAVSDQITQMEAFKKGLLQQMFV